MKRTTVLSLLLVMLFALAAPGASAMEDAENDYLEGYIGPYPVQVDISPSKNGPVKGRYRYIRNGRPDRWFALEGTVFGWKSAQGQRGDTGFIDYSDSCRMKLVETSAGGAKTGKWYVTYEASNAPMGLVVTIYGTFVNTKSGEKFRIHLQYRP